MRIAMISFATASVLSAQTSDFGKAYSFDERKPKTQVERTVDKLMPSIVKIHGASGLATVCGAAARGAAAAEEAGAGRGSAAGPADLSTPGGSSSSAAAGAGSGRAHAVRRVACS